MNRFLVAAMTTLALAACSNDDVVPDGGEVDGTGSEGTKWIALDIKTSSTTRAINNPDKENGTINESTVTKTSLLLFDSNKELIEVHDLAANEGTPGQPTGSSGNAIKVPESTAYLFVVANPSAKFDVGEFQVKTESQSGASSETILRKVLTASVDDVTKANAGANQDYFMMTNSNGDLGPTDGSGNLSAIATYTSATEAEANPVEIYIDRVVAKVRVSYTGGTGGGGVVVGNVKWVLNVTNKKFFPASERIKTEAETLLNRQVWSDRDNQGSYRKDPNYNNAGITLSDEYNYYSSSSVIGSIPWLTATATATIDYCLENTQIEDDNVHAYTTQLLVQAQYAPADFTTSNDGTTSNSDAAINWFKISGKNYSFATLMLCLAEELTAKYSSANPEAQSSPLATAVNAYLTAKSLGTYSISLPATAAAFTAISGTNTADKVATLLSAFSGGESAMLAGTVGSLSFYKSGLNYYKVMIKHDNMEEADTDVQGQNLTAAQILNKLGEFGVVRNSLYDIVIASITNPGYSVIPDPDPEKKNEEEDEPMISVRINVNPWTWYTQTEDL